MGKIAEVVVPAGGQATIDFPGIPATYKHLVVVFNGRTDQAGATDILAQVNGDAGANYDYWGTAAAYNQTAFKAGSIPGTGAPAWAQGDGSIDLLNYPSTTINKTFSSSTARQDLSGSAGFTTSDFGSWHTTGTAITRVTLLLSAGNFAAGTVATLYGVDSQVAGVPGAGAKQKIAEVITAAAQSAVDFTAIPQTFRSLELVVSLRATSGGDAELQGTINGDTGANYDTNKNAGHNTYLRLGTATGSNDGASLRFDITEALFMNYANTAMSKMVRTIETRSDTSSQGVSQNVNDWFSTAAMTSLHLYLSATTFVAGCTLTLYGTS